MINKFLNSNKADTIMLCIALDSAEWCGAELPVIAI